MLVLTLSYDGSAFAGSQMQPGVRTVQAELERGLTALGFDEPRTSFASRTDRGVHAAGQIASCGDARPAMSRTALQRGINAHLPDDLRVVGVERREDGFHPRYDAHWREYRYRLLSGEEAPLARSVVWHRRRPLALGLMAAAARMFEGRQDFAAVAGGGDGVPWAVGQLGPRGTVRTVGCCECREIEPWWGSITGSLYEVRIIADGFLPRMVRNIVGIVADVGGGTLDLGAVRPILDQRDRRGGRGTAPAHGLTLWRIGYETRPPDVMLTGGRNPSIRRDESQQLAEW